VLLVHLIKKGVKMIKIDVSGIAFSLFCIGVAQSKPAIFLPFGNYFDVKLTYIVVVY